MFGADEVQIMPPCGHFMFLAHESETRRHKEQILQPLQ